MAKDIDVLIERGDKQLAEAHKLIADHKNNSRSHLFDVLGREIKELEYKLAQMKTLVKNATKRTSKINYMQEGLLSVTNRIGVELEFVEEVLASRNAANNLFSAPTLASRAQRTVQPKNLKLCMETPLGGRTCANGSSVPIGTLSGNTSG